VIAIFAAFALGRFAVATVRGGYYSTPSAETEPVYPQQEYPGSVWDRPAGRQPRRLGELQVSPRGVAGLTAWLRRVGSHETHRFPVRPGSYSAPGLAATAAQATGPVTVTSVP
jgi:hypothetical protein